MAASRRLRQLGRLVQAGDKKLIFFPGNEKPELKEPKPRLERGSGVNGPFHFMIDRRKGPEDRRKVDLGIRNRKNPPWEKERQ